MPGLVGFTKKHENNIEKNNDLSEKMSKIICNSQFHKIKAFVENQFYNNVVSFDFQSDDACFQNESLSMWIYGDPIISQFSGSAAIKKVFSHITANYPDFSCFSAIDGIYSIVIYDKIQDKLFLITDRNGLGHLYYIEYEREIYWASELRAFLAGDFKVTLKKSSIEAYLELGHLINNSTWFNEINLIPPASFLEWDFKTSALSITQYWNYKGNNSVNSPRKMNVIGDDLTDLFREAVKKRVNNNERIGITLSGGLDSRTIFANIPQRENKFTAVTRGVKDAGDIIIAKQTVAVRNDVEHIIVNLDENNWLNGRVEAVSATSAQKNLIHMNSLSSLPFHKKYFDINLDGAGGGILKESGSPPVQNTSSLEQHLSNKYLKCKFQFNENVLDELSQYYREIDSSQYFYVFQRARRFTVFGSILGHDYGIISRFPLLDNDLQDYVYSLPRNIDLGYIYRALLIKKYLLDYNQIILNLQTGFRLYADSRINYSLKILNFICEKAGLKVPKRKYHQYDQWMRTGKGFELINKYGFMPDSILYEYADRDILYNILNKFIAGSGDECLVSRIITLNLFFEELKNKKII
jgi:asparagine synthase (glutamine-hydrolysing)